VTVKQDIIYHKQALHKARILRTKSENPPTAKGKEETSKTVSPGQWIEFVMFDVNGKPKTVKAWVPNQN